MAGVLVCGLWCGAEPQKLDPPGEPLAGTAPWDLGDKDPAAVLVEGVDRFLEGKLAASAALRDRYWDSVSGEAAAWDAAAAAQRGRLAELLGAVEARPGKVRLERVATLRQSSLVATSAWVRVEAVRWRAFGDVHGEGLMLVPAAGEPMADVLALPDADVTPEQLAGLEEGLGPEAQYARRLAESGCRVVVPYLVDRAKGGPKVDWDPARGRNLSNREFLHRPAFEMGRTLAGYELVKVLAAADGLSSDVVDDETADPERPLGVLGWGEGGRYALYCGALDERFRAVGISGAFGPRERSWEEPLDRNFFGILDRLGDAEIAGLVSPRALIVEAAEGPLVAQPSDGAAPAVLGTIPPERVRGELERARRRMSGPRPGASRLRFFESGGGSGAPWSEPALAAFVEALKPGGAFALRLTGTDLTDLRGERGVGDRADRQRRELDLHTQRLLQDSASVRREFFKGLDTSTPEAFAASQGRYREIFSENVIGRFDEALSGFGARSRRAYDDAKWTGYEVALDVFPGVMAYGLLLLPRDLGPGERRPVVVCQHGLEGRPQDLIGKSGFEAYAAFAARLAEQGFITFAPQNLYLFRDRFRVLQRKANPLGKTLFSVIVPQHRQIVGWLKSQPFVDPSRIAFYGLSYGGKTAMRVPPLVGDYCLSICSADFNEWVWKNASTRSPYSYVWTGEYEIFEWNLGHTFNYAEMAALIAPRPFMVERGHFDGVAPDETVGYEFAKVRHLYAARLRLPAESCQIEWFVGPHTIHGVGTYEFLRRHLRWPGAAR